MLLSLEQHEMLFRSCGPAAITGQFLQPPWVSTGKHFLYFFHFKEIFCLGFSYFFLCGFVSSFISVQIWIWDEYMPF
jgi:hypothetical protein